MGLFKKRLTAIQTNFGSAHFPRTWSESALRPPSWPEGPRKGPFQPAPPPWPSVGRCLAQGSERLPGTAARARSPTRPPRPPPGLGVCCGCPARERAGASRTVPGRRPGGARPPRYGRSKLKHGTRKPGDGTRKLTQATRKRPNPPVFARPPADTSRPAAPTASRSPLLPLVVRGGLLGGGKGRVPASYGLAPKPLGAAVSSGDGLPRLRLPGHISVYGRGRPPQAAGTPLGVFPALGRPRRAVRRPVGCPPRRDSPAGHVTRKPAQAVPPQVWRRLPGSWPGLRCP